LIEDVLLPVLEVAQSCRSDTPLAAVIGRDVLQAGGNAADAALVMVAVVNVTEPMPRRCRD
jgi:gamma-glutamyltranspeptidase